MRTITKSLFFIALTFNLASIFGQATLSQFSYVQNFDNLASGLPEGWSVRIGASSTSNGTAQTFNTDAISWSTTSAGFRNVASAEAPLSADATPATQEQSSDRALGLRQTAAFGDAAADLPIFSFQIENTQGIFDFSLNFKLMQCQNLEKPIQTTPIS